MLPLDNQQLIFLCSPSVTSLDELVSRRIKLSDVPTHDATRDLVLLSENWCQEYNMTRKLEILTDKLQNMYKDLDKEKQLTDRLLYSVLPPQVANELRLGNSVPARKYPHVTLLFSGIVGFSDYCSSQQGTGGQKKIVSMLNTLFSAWDQLTDPKLNPEVYKVETVLDSYMAVSGLPEECKSHARNMANLALHMKEISQKCCDDDNNPIVVTLGLHSGEVVTGVIGNKTPRYCLFGNTVNLASRTKSTGVDGKINVSQYTAEYLKNDDNIDETLHLEERGKVQMKGKKEPMLTYVLSRKPKPLPIASPSGEKEQQEEASVEIVHKVSQVTTVANETIKKSSPVKDEKSNQNGQLDKTSVTLNSPIKTCPNANTTQVPNPSLQTNIPPKISADTATSCIDQLPDEVFEFTTNLLETYDFKECSQEEIQLLMQQYPVVPPPPPNFASPNDDNDDDEKNQNLVIHAHINDYNSTVFTQNHINTINATTPQPKDNKVSPSPPSKKSQKSKHKSSSSKSSTPPPPTSSTSTINAKPKLYKVTQV